MITATESTPLLVVSPFEKQVRKERSLPGWPAKGDPRVPFACLLTLYAVMGCTILRFNRDPIQIGLTVLATCLLDMVFFFFLKKRDVLFPLSAYISGLSLALLINYSHNYYLLFVPVFLTVASKYLLTFDDKHVFNPSMFGVAISLLIGGDLISTAPAYQWGGTWAMSAFLVMTAFSLFIFKIKRNPLILAFLGFYILQIAVRAYIMRWHLPWQALFFGTLTSAPFFLFVFFMITDPKTSPDSPRAQILLAFSLVAVDLYLHKLQSLYTFFYAALIVASIKFLSLHLRQMNRAGLLNYLSNRLFARQTIKTFVIVIGFGGMMVALYRGWIHPAIGIKPLNFALEKVASSESGISSNLSPTILTEVDPRVQHIAKWLLAEGDSVAAGDVDNDGFVDLFFTNALKIAEDRNVLYVNRGNFRFERVPIPALHGVSGDPKQYGLVTNAVFADVDNDGDQDLFLTVAFGKSFLLWNRLIETGGLLFEKDVSVISDEHTASVSANFFDFDRDGQLDLLVGNALNPHLPGYDKAEPLNIFNLPQPAYPGDRRMFNFMHASWDNATNGGLNLLYKNEGQGRFKKIDIGAMGMPETHWTLAVGSGDLNKDGWTDLYLASDFGPDDLYLNEQGRRFRRIQGKWFGSVGKDTYKGMNSAFGDIDRNGFLDVYVSNVHMRLQSEGSLLWMTYPSEKDSFVPDFKDEATKRGLLNEHRFGWGGALGDLNNDGWLDVVQANGMVDDMMDKRYDVCREYWYINEKLMRAGPEIHTYADMWGDLRGYCINGHDANRIYLNRGSHEKTQFVDVASQLGWKEETPSRGVALADLDNDGSLDVVITHPFATASIYRNESSDAAGANHDKPSWIGFKLEGDGISCNRDAAGTQVTVISQASSELEKQLAEITIVNGFAAQNDRRLHFGLGQSAEPVDVEVAWCGSPPVLYRDYAVNQYHTIRQTNSVKENDGHRM